MGAMTDTPTPRSQPVDRLGLEVLGPDECWSLLTTTPVGRLGFVADGGPMVLPVVHATIGRRIAFRSPPGGKLAAAHMGDQVAFEVDGWDEEARSGWSVVARGTAEAAPDDTAELDALDHNPWIPLVAEGTWVEVRVDEISGRRFAFPV